MEREIVDPRMVHEQLMPCILLGVDHPIQGAIVGHDRQLEFEIHAGIAPLSFLDLVNLVAELANDF